ncbi:MAG: UMP kinase [Oscillospiraceae bacterium]|nr:UMP kinase [Oscillospiraceae bacterium]
MEELLYKRVLLKLSGEVLGGTKGFGIDFAVAEEISREIKTCVELGAEVGVVIGGGNFWRGRSSGDMDDVTADRMGMLATVMNCLALSDTLRQIGVETLVLSAFVMPQVCPVADKFAAIEAMKAGKVVLFAGGTGNPFFTTDSGAVLRAAEIEANLVLKATNVDGVYDKDPNKYPDAVRYEELTPTEILQKNLRVMDAAAAALVRDKDLEMLVFNLTPPSNIVKAICGNAVGTMIRNF